MRNVAVMMRNAKTGIREARKVALVAVAEPQIMVNFRIEFHRSLRESKGVRAKTKRQAKSEGEVLDHATSNLLRALKQDMRKKDGRVDFEKLRKDGYSDRLLAKLEQA